MIRHLSHLVRRLGQALVVEPLRPSEQQEAAALLAAGEQRLFWGQPASDQRHGLRCARAVVARTRGRPDLVRAALLHDVGKAAARVGPVGRVAATALGLLRLPAPGRLAIYLAHGPRGAALLEAAGADALTVEYARHHHGTRPPGIAPGDWQLLNAVDRS